MTLRVRILVVYTLLLTSFIVGCGREKKQTAKETAPTPTPQPTAVETPGPTPTPAIMEMEEGVVVEVLTKATGEDVVAEGDIPRLNMSVEAPDGEKIWDGTFEFQVGTGQGAPGLDLGVRGMKVGEKRRLKLSAAMAKAPSDSGPLAKGRNVVINLELLEIKHPTEN